MVKLVRLLYNPTLAKPLKLYSKNHIEGAIILGRAYIVFMFNFTSNVLELLLD